MFRFKIKIKDGEGERWVDASKVFAHLMGVYNRNLLKGKGNMEKRLKKFRLDVLQSECTEEYDYNLLEEFIEYWTEPNKSGTKMKFELEKTWSLSRRVKKWKSNGFGKAEKPTDGRSQYKKYVTPEIPDEDLCSPEEINELMQGIKDNLSIRKRKSEGH